MSHNYGQGASTFEAVGGLIGIRQLVSDFYNLMGNSNAYKALREMHPQNLEVSKDKLSCFLSGWMGGQALYQKKYGSINIPKAHEFIKIGIEERDMWMACMTEALQQQELPKALTDYLIEQLSIPAERVRLASEAYHQNQT